MAKKNKTPSAIAMNDAVNDDDVRSVALLDGTDQAAVEDSTHHSFGNDFVCGTDEKGVARSREEIVVDTTDGFVPLWAENQVLRWRFNESSMRAFRYPDQAKEYIEKLFDEAILAWGDAAPIRFSLVERHHDFEIYMSGQDKCRSGGCTLASAFFPDAGRHRLTLYPKMFGQTRAEQVDTFTHEIGHIFGLRHFFAQERESAWPSAIFGEHDKFSIMNYGALSTLTNQDQFDLKLLYELVWSRKLRSINGTPVVLFKPYHTQVNMY